MTSQPGSLNQNKYFLFIYDSVNQAGKPLSLCVRHEFSSRFLRYFIPSGNADIVRLLMKSDADLYRLMGGQSVVDIARDFDHLDIVKILTEIGFE